MCDNYVLSTIKTEIFGELSASKTEIFIRPIIPHHHPHLVNHLFHDFKIRLTRSSRISTSAATIQYF